MTCPMKIFHDQTPPKYGSRRGLNSQPLDQRSESLKNYALGPAIVGCFDVYVLVNSYDHVNDVEAVSSLHCNHTFFLGKLDLNWSTSTSCKYFPL